MIIWNSANSRQTVRSFTSATALTILGQLLPVAAMPVLTRLYTPEDFGLFAVFFAVVSTLGAVAGLRMEQGIVAEATAQDAAATLAMASVTALLVSGSIAGMGYLVGAILSQGSEAWAGLSFWLGIALTSTALYMMNALTLTVLREGAMLAPARAKLVQGVVQAVVPIAGGMGGAGAAGLILGQMLGFLIGAGALVSSTKKAACQTDFLSLKGARSAWRRQRLYRLYAAPALLLNTGSKMLPVVVLAAAWGSVVAGQVAVAQRLLFAPARLLGQTISQFYIARAARLARTDVAALRNLFAKHVLFLMVAGSILFLPVFLISGDMVAFALGEEWRLFDRTLKLLIPLAWADFVLFPVGQTLNLINRHRVGFFVDLTHACLITFMFASGFWTSQPAENVLLWWGLTTFVCYLVALAICYLSLCEEHRVQLDEAGK